MKYAKTKNAMMVITSIHYLNVTRFVLQLKAVDSLKAVDDLLQQSMLQENYPDEER